MPYPTLAEYKAWAGISPAEYQDDATLTALLARAIAMIEGPQPLGTGRTFVAVSETRFADCPEPGERLLPLWDVGDLAQITTVTNGDGALIAPTEFVTRPRRNGPIYALELKSSSNVRWAYADSPEGAISIAGYWGYSIDVPPDIYQAHLRLTDFLYRSRGGSGDQAVRTEGGVILPSRLPKDIEDILAGYRDVLGGEG